MIVDWDEWEASLTRFSRATGLCVSGYDEQGVRRVGPVHDSAVAALLASAGAFDAGDEEEFAATGAGYRIEAGLLQEVLRTGVPASRTIGGELTVLCAPIMIGGERRGALVYGWVFPGFGTPLGCQRLGAELGVDGTLLWSAVRLTPPVPPVRLVVFSELLETLVAAAARHAEALERINAMSRMREVFLAGVSHELRTPLSALSLRIEILLRSEGLTEPMAAALRKMRQHVADQARLVDDLIEASRTRTGHLVLDRQPACLDDVLAAALTATMPHADTKEIEVIAEGLQEGGLHNVLADRHRLQQVFWNLLSNAVKFTPPGGRIALSLHSDGRGHEIVVADNGRGMDPEMLPRVFDAFQKTQDGNHAGLGLGLSIARHIVEAHGGTVVARSDGIDRGARFVVHLPQLVPAFAGMANGGATRPPG